MSSRPITRIEHQFLHLSAMSPKQRNHLEPAPLLILLPNNISGPFCSPFGGNHAVESINFSDMSPTCKPNFGNLKVEDYVNASFQSHLED